MGSCLEKGEKMTVPSINNNMFFFLKELGVISTFKREYNDTFTSELVLIGREGKCELMVDPIFRLVPVGRENAELCTIGHMRGLLP